MSSAPLVIDRIKERWKLARRGRTIEQVYRSTERKCVIAGHEAGETKNSGSYPYTEILISAHGPLLTTTATKILTDNCPPNRDSGERYTFRSPLK